MIRRPHAAHARDLGGATIFYNNCHELQVYKLLVLPLDPLGMTWLPFMAYIGSKIAPFGHTAGRQSCLFVAIIISLMEHF